MSDHSTAGLPAPDHHAVNKEQFVFGYGSLAGEHLRCPVARLRGWRRAWGVAMDNSVDLPGYKAFSLRTDGSRPAVFVAFLDIEPDPTSSVTGVCVPVEDSDLHALDDRERNYDRVDLTTAGRSSAASTSTGCWPAWRRSHRTRSPRSRAPPPMRGST